MFTQIGKFSVLVSVLVSVLLFNFYLCKNLY
nr:MAG TPA: hypothetical protein [Caudoviricetes sp.]